MAAGKHDSNGQDQSEGRTKRQKRFWRPNQDCQSRITNPRLPIQDCQSRLPIQDCQSKIAHPGLPIQDCQSKVANPKDKSFEGLEQTGDTGQTIDQGQKEDFLVKE